MADEKKKTTAKKTAAAKKTTVAKAVAKPVKRTVKPKAAAAAAGRATAAREAAAKKRTAAAGRVASGRPSRPQRPTASAGEVAASSERGLPSTRPAAAEGVASKPAREARPIPTAPAGQVPVIGLDGSVSGALALPAGLGESVRRSGVLSQVLTVAASNAHLGTAATKNRSRVSGGGAKPWRQKGTGRARQGSTRAPHWRHGGVVFGPNGRRYLRRIPGKMRREAFAEAFAGAVGAGRVLAYEGIAFDGAPRTKTVVDWLGKVGDTGSVLIVTPTVDHPTARAASNAAGVAVRSVGALRTTDVLTHDTVLVRRDALDALAARAATREGGAA